MIINRQALLDAAPIGGMIPKKIKANGVSHGLSEAGYDIRIKQEIFFCKSREGNRVIDVNNADGSPWETKRGRFVLASSIERFQMPDTLVGVVHDKSTWARKGLSVFNTVIEPGWKGWLTLELVYHGEDELRIPAGAGIAQVLFSAVGTPSSYEGKYMNQANEPVPAIFEG